MATGETFPGYQKYQSDAGGVYKIRMSQDAISISGSADPVGALTDGRVKVSVSGHGRKRLSGIKARGLVLGLPTSVGATTYTSRTFVPTQTPTAWAAYAVGALVTYQAGQWQILDKIGEA